MKSRISIVIPAYNEAAQIADCLRAISKLRAKPYEVIVVDNNSTDDTARVARRFKFVKVISAKRQGVVYARDRGFNAARGDIIGRIDADTRVPRDWTERVAEIFADGTVDAVSGAISYYDVPLKSMVAKADLYLRRRAARHMGEDVFLQAANMACRKRAWRETRDHVCRRAGLHEDFDLAIHLTETGNRVIFDERLKASISARCIDDGVRDFWSYALLNPTTYFDHELRSGRHMFLNVGLMILFHVPLRMMYRSYNAQQLRDGHYVRVNPATYVDP